MRALWQGDLRLQGDSENRVKELNSGSCSRRCRIPRGFSDENRSTADERTTGSPGTRVHNGFEIEKDVI